MQYCMIRLLYMDESMQDGIADTADIIRNRYIRLYAFHNLVRRLTKCRWLLIPTALFSIHFAYSFSLAMLLKV